MKEILYIQAGNIANYVDNFGTLARDNALGNERADDAAGRGLWSGSIQPIRQPPIERSAYQAFLTDNSLPRVGGRFPTSQESLRGNVRYWSDYSRLYYVPRSLHPISEPSEWDGPQGNWGLGQDTFRAYNEKDDLMEDSVRLFLEECDTLQGIQVINDSGTYSGFTASFLTAFQDEYRKTPALVFPLLSGLDADAGTNDSHSVRGAISDALYLRALNDMASMTVPIQPLTQWSPGVWRRWSDVDKSNPYYTSAVVAPCIESATLPTRLSAGQDDIASLAAKLQLHARSPFSELSGAFPLPTVPTDGLSDTAEFSIPRSMKELHSASAGCRIDVTRGFTAEAVKAFEAHIAAAALLDSAQYISRCHTLEYPLPTSFPSFLLPDSAIEWDSRKSLTATTPDSIVGSIRGVASLSSGRGKMGLLFKKYANFAETCLKKRVHAASTGSGIDHDELNELIQDLWSMHDNSGGADYGGVDELDG